MEMSAEFYACSFIFVFVCDVDSLFVFKPFAIPKNKVKLFLKCHFLIIYFSQRKPWCRQALWLLYSFEIGMVIYLTLQGLGGGGVFRHARGFLPKRWK